MQDGIGCFNSSGLDNEEILQWYDGAKFSIGSNGLGTYLYSIIRQIVFGIDEILGRV